MHRYSPARALAFACAVLAHPVPCLAAGTDAPPSGLEIIQKTDAILDGESKHSVLQMKVERPKRERLLRLETWSKGTRQWLIRILDPPKEAGIASLRVGAEIWNYQPRVERVIRISPSMLGQSWMGSDLTYDELLKASSIVTDYDHALKGTETREGQQVFRVESTAKPRAPAVWARQVHWVRTEDFVPVRQEFWSETGEMVKAVTFSEVKAFKGHPFPTKWVVQPEKRAGELTTLQFDLVEFDLPIRDDLFTLQSLKDTR